MTKNADGFQSSHLRSILDVDTLEFLLKSFRQRFIKDKASSIDHGPLLVRQTEMEKLRRALLCLEYDPRWEAEVAYALREWVVKPVLSGVPVQDSGFELSLHYVSVLEAE